MCGCADYSLKQVPPWCLSYRERLSAKIHDWLIGRHKQTHSCHVKLGYTAYTAVGRHEISGYKCRQSRSWKTVKLHFVVRRSRVIKYLFYTLFISNRFEFSIIVLFGFEQRLRHSMSTTFSENWKNSFFRKGIFHSSRNGLKHLRKYLQFSKKIILDNRISFLPPRTATKWSQTKKIVFPQRNLPQLSEGPKTYTEVFAIFEKDHFGQPNFIFTP